MVEKDGGTADFGLLFRRLFFSDRSDGTERKMRTALVTAGGFVYDSIRKQIGRERIWYRTRSCG